MNTPPGFTALVAANIQDPSGALLVAGTLTVVPTDPTDVPIDAVAGGAGGALSTLGAIFPVANGVVGPAALLPTQTWMGLWSSIVDYAIGGVVKYTDGNYYAAILAGTDQVPTTATTYWAACANAVGPWLADTALTKPANISYRFIVKNAQGRPIYTVKGLQFAAAPTPTASVNFDTATPPGTAVAPYTQGPAGTNGQGFRFRNAWAADAVFAAYDVYTYAGSSYVVQTPYTATSSFGSTDLTNSALFISGGVPANSFVSALAGTASVASNTVLGAVTNTATVPQSGDATMNIYGAPFPVSGALTELQLSFYNPSATARTAQILIRTGTGNGFTIVASFNITPVAAGGYSTQTFTAGSGSGTFPPINVEAGQYIACEGPSANTGSSAGAQGFWYAYGFSTTVGTTQTFTQLGGATFDLAATVTVATDASGYATNAQLSSYATASALASVASATLTTGYLASSLTGPNTVTSLGGVTNAAAAPGQTDSSLSVIGPFTASTTLTGLQISFYNPSATPVTIDILSGSEPPFTVVATFTITPAAASGFSTQVFNAPAAFAPIAVASGSWLGIGNATVAKATSGGAGFYYIEGFQSNNTVGASLSAAFASGCRLDVLAVTDSNPPVIDASGYATKTQLATLATEVAVVAAGAGGSRAGEVFYFEGSSITYGYTLPDAANVTGGGVVGCFPNLISQSAWAAGATFYNDGVSGNTSTGILAQYTGGQTVYTNSPPSAHSLSPAVTGNTTYKHWYILDLSELYNDYANSISYSTALANLNSICSQAKTDGWYVVIVSLNVNFTNAGATSFIQAIWQAVRDGQVPWDQYIEGADFIPNQAGPMYNGQVHPNAEGHKLFAANLLVALQNGSIVNFSGGYHTLPQTFFGGVTLYDSAGSAWALQVSTAGVLSAVSTTVVA